MHRNVYCITKNLATQQNQTHKNDEPQKYMMQIPTLLITLRGQDSGAWLHLPEFSHCSTQLWVPVGINAFSSQLPIMEL